MALVVGVSRPRGLSQIDANSVLTGSNVLLVSCASEILTSKRMHIKIARTVASDGAVNHSKTNHTWTN